MRLTDKTVEGLALLDGKGERLVFDETLPGFGIRLRAGGKRTWIAQYRTGSQQRRLTLGDCAKIDAVQARKLAKDALAKVQLGQDPQAEKAVARVPKTRGLTLGELVESYLPFARRKLKPTTYSGVVLHLRKHWAALHPQELKAIERRHVAAEIGRIAARSGLYGANRSRAALSTLFSWAIGEGIADVNPVVGTNKATEEISRDRVLSPEELGLAWENAGTGGYATIVRLLILTGQRREEVGGMLWSELSLDSALWTIGRDRTKNGLLHEVPLSGAAVSIIRGIPRVEGRDYVFGTRNGPFQGWSNAKKSLDARMGEALKRDRGQSEKLASWRLHDVRRTVATRLGDLGVLPHVVEAVLNHISGHRAGVAGTYNRATYSAEKRAALTAWAEQFASRKNSEL